MKEQRAATMNSSSCQLVVVALLGLRLAVCVEAAFIFAATGGGRSSFCFAPPAGAICAGQSLEQFGFVPHESFIYGKMDELISSFECNDLLRD